MNSSKLWREYVIAIILTFTRQPAHSMHLYSVYFCLVWPQRSNFSVVFFVCSNKAPSKQGKRIVQKYPRIWKWGWHIERLLLLFFLATFQIPTVPSLVFVPILYPSIAILKDLSFFLSKISMLFLMSHRQISIPSVASQICDTKRGQGRSMRGNLIMWTQWSKLAPVSYLDNT